MKNLSLLLVLFFVYSLIAFAQDTTLSVTSNGNVGIGTTSPVVPLHIGNVSDQDALRIGSRGDIFDWTLYQDVVGIGSLRLKDGNGNVVMVWQAGGGGNVGIGTIGPNHPLEMGSGAHVTAGGVWTNASSREFKENILQLNVDEAIETLSGLVPVKFNYKADKDEEYIGFIAEEVPELVATNDRKGLSSMDIIAVLTKVVQQQQKKIEELEARFNAGF